MTNDILRNSKNVTGEMSVKEKNYLLAASFFSKGHYDERLVIANANRVGRVEKRARQGGMAECRAHVSSHSLLG